MSAVNFYTRVYEGSGYAEFASPAKHFAFGDLSRFVETYDLRTQKCLEVGCGRGLFQDLVDDYTGVDLSASAARYLRKPFVCSDATTLPFRDDSFDALWSITVLEHVPDPARALSEMRRVVRPGGLVFLKVAWHCRPWNCEGIPVRPYSSLSLRQRWIKATLPFRESLPVRAIRYGAPRLARVPGVLMRRAPMPLPGRKLPANYDQFWMVDSDAAVSLDPFDVIAWFRSRGDEVLSHPTLVAALRSRSEPIVIQVR